jgi:nucleoside-diphosphate-sugar epimerase
VKEICRDKNIKYQIVRPSVVCGRLIHEPLYYTPKFNVFYLLGRFVMSYKNRLEPGQSVRLQLYRENTLNIVSSDFVAQVICDVMFKDDIEQINITAQNAVKIGKLLSYLPEDEQVKQFVFTESVVEDPNNIEKLYQKTVGEQITRYFVGDNMNFSPDFRQKVCPHLTEPEPLEYADGLVRFALEHEFADIG